ncbi:MAG TPA: ABC transporter ATP-binding protein [Candidatus Acidoferrum sp.]|nr:ABC transporter ATP-binding protein [Candidatus Acidoferrum sp.]
MSEAARSPIGPAAARAVHADHPLVSLRDVRVTYDGVAVLTLDALEARPGEVLAIIGPNGSGKSTLLRIMGWLERPAAGRVCWRGRAIAPGQVRDIRRRIAIVFQQPLLASMTVADNVALGLRFRGVPARERRERTAHWLDRFGIAALADRRATTLSGGEAQRVALARALVLEPELLLLDEPFSGLDAPARASLIPELAAVLRDDRVSTVMVTHDRGEAQALGDRVAVLIGGRLRQVDETAVVFRAPVSEEVARFVGVETIVTGEVTAAGAGTVTVEVAGRALEIAASAAPGERVRVAIRPEDVTLTLPEDRPVASSARNHLRGRVVQVRASPPHVHVVVDCGFPLVAAVTPRSIDELGLAPGADVTAVFKATAAHLLRDAACLDTPAEKGL